MQPKRFKGNNNPEGILQNDWLEFLAARGWYCKSTHGGMYQAGFPDVYATHKTYGPRWIEIKLPEMKGSKFTSAQKECFPLLAENGTPIWILTTVCEYEYRKLFEYAGTGNWGEYFLLHHW